MTELRLKIFDESFTIAAQLYGNASNGIRVIAYPGWLDNSGSFKYLAAAMADLGFLVVAIDPPGCGYSDHLPLCSAYNDFDEVRVLFEVADALGWSTFSCLAHSRGSGICVWAAGAMPLRIKSLILLDSWLGLNTGSTIGAALEPPSQREMLCAMSTVVACDVCGAAQLMREALETDLRNRTRGARVFSSFDDAVEHSLKNPWFPKERQTAVAIVERHLMPVPDALGTFSFTHDTRTYGQRQLVHATNASNLVLMFGVRSVVAHS
jgi:pimeloyl-ACP methyl ester carboxylesterase